MIACRLGISGVELSGCITKETNIFSAVTEFKFIASQANRLHVDHMNRPWSNQRK
jgi:hypothetical protein